MKKPRARSARAAGGAVIFAAPFVVTMALTSGAWAGTPKKDLPPAWAGAAVEKNPDGTCWQRWSEGCGPGDHCNPGPPRQVRCPGDEKPAPPSPSK